MRADRLKRRKRAVINGRLCCGLLGVAVAAVMAVAAPADAATSSAGTSIGNATQLTGAASGSLSSSIADNWYVVYPSKADGTVDISVKNTTSENAACTTVYTETYNVNGRNGVIDGYAGHGPGTSSAYTLTDSTQYYIELNTNGCSPAAGKAVTYSLKVVSGGGGTAPNPASGTADPGTSIGTVGAPLLGHTIYADSIPASTTDAWYVLYKAAGTAAATVRIVNTTVSGSSGCSAVYTEIYDSDGRAGVVDGYAGLGDNSAATYSFTTAGQYYIELNLNGCSPGSTKGPTYSIEPEPAAQWTAARSGASAYGMGTIHV